MGKSTVPHQIFHKRNYKQRIIRKYKTTEEKLQKFSNTQRDEQDSMRKFYPRVINKTNIVFPSDELLLLNKSLKYNLSYKHKNLIRTLALGAETTINQLPGFEQEHTRYQDGNNTKAYINSKKKYNT